jgi:RNA polymerase sigma-70 factor (ECF subfamily)
VRVSDWEQTRTEDPAPPARDSFDECFAAGYWPLVRSLTVMSGDREMAADCVQEAFVRAYTRWRRIGRYDQPLAWVRRVAINALRDHHRKQVRGEHARARLGAPTAAGAPEVPGFDLAAVLASLPVQQRIAAALFYVDDLSVAEVADAMGLSSGAVKFHLHAARERLRGELTGLETGTA